MFEKLFLLVKNNAGPAIINNSLISAKYHDAVINDASSSIIEVLKDQLENGKLKELVKYVQFDGLYDNPLITQAVSSFANKLNDFYDINPTKALDISASLITPVMHELMRQSKIEQTKEFSLETLLSKISGKLVDMNLLFNQIRTA